MCTKKQSDRDKKKVLIVKSGSPPIRYQRDFVFLSHNLGKLPRKYENLNSGLREQVKQKTELPFNFKDTFSFTRCSHTNLCSKAYDCYQNG